jgi:hypothetical protein
MDDRGYIPCKDRDFSLHYRVQTGSGAHPGLYPMRAGGGGSSPGGKTVGS